MYIMQYTYIFPKKANKQKYKGITLKSNNFANGNTLAYLAYSFRRSLCKSLDIFGDSFNTPKKMKKAPRRMDRLFNTILDMSIFFLQNKKKKLFGGLQMDRYQSPSRSFRGERSRSRTGRLSSGTYVYMYEVCTYEIACRKGACVIRQVAWFFFNFCARILADCLPLS